MILLCCCSLHLKTNTYRCSVLLLKAYSPKCLEGKFSEVWRHASSNRYFSRPMHALRRELLFRSSFQILYHALQHVDDRRVLLFGDALQRSSSHLALQLEDGFTLSLARLGEHKLRSVALPTLYQPPFLDETVDDLVQLACVDEGLHGVEDAASRNGVCLVDDVEHLPAETREAVVAEHPIDVLGDDLVGVLEPITDGLLLRYVLLRHESSP